MAARFASIGTSGVATGTSPKTVLQIKAPANQALRVNEASISFAGVNNTHEPILVELIRQTTAGTATTILAVPRDFEDDWTPQATCKHTATVEPTTKQVTSEDQILSSMLIHPQSGVVYPMLEGAPIVVGGGGYLGMRVSAANDVDCAPNLVWEE